MVSTLTAFKNKIVVAIPYWESDEGKRDVLKRCLSSLEGHNETLVLAGRQETLPGAWNMCMELGFSMGATHVILANDDIILNRGNLSMLCETEDEVISPTVNDGALKVFHMHIASIPLYVWEKVGPFDERFKVYWSDTDYAKRMVDAGINVRIDPRVNVLHPEPARTIKKVSGIEKEDKQKFQEKWGRTWIDPIVEC